ncbi:MAG: hypothetical protein ACM36C_04045, partial [Acidobacteriota bacterium]
MVGTSTGPTTAAWWVSLTSGVFVVLNILGLACFAWILARRIQPLLRAQRDPRLDRPLARILTVLKFWLGQWRHPRYPVSGLIHVLVF